MVPRMKATVQPLLGPRSAGAYAIVLALVAAGAALAAAAVLVQGLTRDGADVTVFLTDGARLALDDRLDLPEGAVLLGNLVPVDLHVPDLPLGLRLLARLGTVLLFLAIAGGALALAQVLQTVRAGRPFARRNAGLLVLVAVAVVVGGAVAPLARDAAALAALDHLGLTGEDSPFLPQMSVPLTPALVAVVVLALAEAFRRGAAMADDVAGLV
jgi:hypothetical protein